MERLPQDQNLCLVNVKALVGWGTKRHNNLMWLYTRCSIMSGFLFNPVIIAIYICSYLTNCHPPAEGKTMILTSKSAFWNQIREICIWIETHQNLNPTHTFCLCCHQAVESQKHLNQTQKQTQDGSCLAIGVIFRSSFSLSVPLGPAIQWVGGKSTLVRSEKTT